MDKLQFARHLRTESTDAERRLWARLRGNQLYGTKWRRQVPFGPYFLDFYCHAAHLVVEADGDQHAADSAVEADHARAAFLKVQGITALRFGNRDILMDTDAVVAAIIVVLARERSDVPSP